MTKDHQNVWPMAITRYFCIVSTCSSKRTTWFRYI